MRLSHRIGRFRFRGIDGVALRICKVSAPNTTSAKERGDFVRYGSPLTLHIRPKSVNTFASVTKSPTSTDEIHSLLWRMNEKEIDRI
ncbi:MAG: hypothetical protein SNG38_07790 [Rikenellaceae bacterium]